MMFQIGDRVRLKPGFAKKPYWPQYKDVVFQVVEFSTNENPNDVIVMLMAVSPIGDDVHSYQYPGFYEFRLEKCDE